MKAIQIMMDPDLLADLDATEEVKQEGRSAILRRAAAEYLERRRTEMIRERYHRAYADEGSHDEELAGWAEEGSWPGE